MKKFFIIFLYFKIFFWDLINFVSSQCLISDQLAQNCYLCSSIYYHEEILSIFPISSCKLKINSYYTSNIVITKEKTSFDSSKWKIYDSLSLAFNTEDLLTRKYTNGELNFYLTKETNFFWKSKIGLNSFFRFNDMSVNIQPLYCNSTITNINLCYQPNEKATVYLKTGELFIFISNSLTVQNITFDGSDMIFRKIDSTCYLENICCNNNLFNCISETQSITDTSSDSAFALFNMETRIDNPNIIANLKVLNCNFINIYPKLTKSHFKSFLYVNDLPGVVSLENIIISNIYIDNGIFSYKTIENYDIYLNLENKFNLINKFDFKTTLIQYRNFYVRGIGAFLSLSPSISEMIIINLIPSKIALSLKNVTFADTIFPNVQTYSLVNFAGVSNTDHYSFNFINISNGYLIKIQQNSIIKIAKIQVLQYKYQTNLLISIQDSNVVINSGLFDDISSTSSTSKIMISCSKSSFLIDNTIMQNINLLTLVYTDMTPLKFYNSLITNIKLNGDMLYVSNSISDFNNLSIRNINPLNPSIRAQVNIITGYSLNFTMFHSQITWSTVANVLNIQEGHIYVTNCSFTDFPLITALIAQSNMINLILTKMTWKNALAGMLTFNTYQSVNLVAHNLTDCLIDNITITDSYLIKMYSSLIFYINTIVRNVVMAAKTRSYYKVDLSVIYLINSQFENCGYVPDTPVLSKNYDKSIWTLYYGVSFTMINSTYLVNDKVSIRGGFVDAYVMTSNVTIINSVFKVTKQNPLFTYKAVILYLTPYVSIEDSIFENFLCPNVSTTILHDNGGAINFVGSLDYSQQSTSLILVVKNSIFKNNRCITGGAVSCLNINESYFINNTFINNKADKSAGHLSLFYGMIGKFDSNKYENSQAGTKAGAVQILNIDIVSLKKEGIQQAYSLESSGFIHFSLIKDLDISDSKFSDGQSQGYGGAIYLYKTNAKFTSILFNNLYSALSGGGIYLSTNSNIKLFNITALNTSAFEGGFLFVKDCQYTILQDLKIINSHSQFNGAAISIGEALVFSATNVEISNSSSALANGIICLKEPRTTNYEIINLHCKFNKAKYGSCLFVYSNANFSINNFSTVDSIGSAIYFFTLGKAKIVLENFHFERNNLNIDTDKPTFSCLIVFTNVILTMKKGYIHGNLAYEYLINIIDSISDIQEMTFKDGGSFKYESILFFAIEDSEFNISKCSFSPSKLLSETVDSNIKFQAGMGYFEKSLIFLSDVNITNNYHENEGTLKIIESIMTLDLVNFVNNRGKISGALSIKSSNITVTNCVFINNSFTLLTDEEFTDIGFPDQQGANDIYISNTIFDYYAILNIQNVVFKGFNGCVFKIVFLQKLILNNVTFSRYDFSKMNGLIIFELNFLTAKNVEFNKFYGTLGAGILLDNDNMNGTYIFDTVVFRECTASVGGAFFVHNFDAFELINIEFHNNKAVTGIQNSIYTLSKTGIGGVGVIECDVLWEWKCKVNMEKILFSYNTADLFAPTIFSKIPLELTDTMIFRSNKDTLNITDKFHSYPIKVLSLNNLTSLVSGVEFDLTFEIRDKFNQKLYYDYLSSSSVSGLYNNQQLNIENGIANYEKGEALFKGLKIYQMPGSNISITVNVDFNEYLFSYDSISKISKQPLEPISLPIYIRPCIPGEIFKEDNSCSRCVAGTFFLDDPMDPAVKIQKCEPCLVNAICLGGNYMLPVDGFWKTDMLSRTIIECPNKNDCQGNKGIENINYIGNFSARDLENGACYPNHHGTLCFECDAGYGKINSDGICRSCDEFKISGYFKMFGMLIIFFIYIWYTVKLYKNILLSSNVQLKVLMKILINQLQQNALITLLDMNWSVEIKDVFGLMQVVSFLSADVFSFDCLFSEFGYNVYILKVIFVLIMPIIFSFFFFLLSIVISAIYIKIYKRNIKMASTLRDVLLFFLVSLFILYPQILKMCFSLINCQIIDERTSLSVMKSYPMIECWTKDHILWVASIGVLGLITWGLLVPGLCLYLLYRYNTSIKIILENDENILHKQSLAGNGNSKISVSSQVKTEKMSVSSINSIKNLKKDDYIIENSALMDANNNEMIKLMSFLFKGFRKDYYYWEILMFLKKFLLTFVINFSGFLTTKAKSVLIAVYFILFIMINIKFRPYVSDILNQFDTASLAISFITANIGILLYSESFSKANYLFVLIIVLSNAAFLVVWVYYFLKMYDAKKGILYKFRVCFFKLLKKLKSTKK